MRPLLLIALLIFAFGCTKKETPAKETKPYIISEIKRKIDKLYKEPRNPEFPPEPIRMFDYGSNNFIIDQKGDIYYYQTRYVVEFCATGRKNDTIPYFIDLHPKDIIQIPNNAITDFIKLNLRKGVRNSIHIASQLDTLNSKNSIELMQSVDKNAFRSDRDVYVVRQTTQEEDTVLQYKKKDTDYFPEDIKWDKNRIKSRKEN